MKCPHDDEGCSGVDTSGMDKIDCKDCPRFKETVERAIVKEDVETDEVVSDLNKFMMGL